MIFDSLASFYDVLNKNKDYQKEVDFLDQILKTHNIKSILDVGCGTGSRSILLNSKNYDVVGIDKSYEMIKIAKSKSRVDFRYLDVLNFETTEKFDCCLILFNVLGYINNIPKLFKIIHGILKKEGILILDYWDSDLLCQNKIKKFKLNFYFSKYNFFIRFVKSTFQDSNIWINYKILKLPQFNFFNEVHHTQTFKKDELIEEASKYEFNLVKEFSMTDIIQMLIFKEFTKSVK